MKSLFSFLGVLIIFNPCFGQFVKATGPITAVFSDSRSVNFIDVNNDDWDDIFISNGKAGGQADMLFLNDKTGNFTQVFGMDLVTQVKPSDGASFADYNQDGHIDAVVSNWYGAMDDLFLNDGNNNLVLNKNAGIASSSYAETAVFGDYNNDGLLDIYITISGGNKINHLYRNLGNGKFQKVNGHTLTDGSKLSRAAIWTDFNNDGYQDLLITNEENGTNDIFLGKGVDSYERYTASSIVTAAESSITASAGDIDNDGDIDVFIGNAGFYTPLKNSLYRNENGILQKEGNSILSQGERCTFGSAFADYDNDGDLDLLVSNGFCYVDMKEQLYQNNGDGSFTDVSGSLPTDNVCSYGCAWGDANNDGFQDVMIANCKNDATDIENPNTLLINTPNQNHWLKIKLVGVHTNTNAIGARVWAIATLHGKKVKQLREISSQSGYAGQNSLTVHFGFADAATVDSLIIRWPDGRMQWLTNLEVNRLHTIIEQTNATLTESNSDFINFEITPNPSIQDSQIELVIYSPISTKAKIWVSDLNGRVMMQKNINTKAGQQVEVLNMHLAVGSYLITVQAGNAVRSKKCIIHE